MKKRRIPWGAMCFSCRAKAPESFINISGSGGRRESFIRPIRCQFCGASVREPLQGRGHQLRTNGRIRHMEKRARSLTEDNSPMAIYEVHPGSWKKHPADEDEERLL